MERHPIACLVEQADAAINREDFAALLDFYAEDAVLVVKPGLNAVGKEQIGRACEKIAAYFKHGLKVEQAEMEILEAGDTALVLARTTIAAPEVPLVERKATYVFKKDARDRWVCAIDNSYGHEVLASFVQSES